jgi:predicted RNA-binding protein with RPS1 domain
MKESRIGILVMLAIFLVGCAQTQTIPYEAASGGRGQGFRKQPYECNIDQADRKPGEVNGRITKMTMETFECFMEPGLAMDVNTPNQGLVHVHLGPLSLLERREPDLRIGDQVSLQVFSYNVAGKSRLIAKEISHQGKTTQLYDHQGLLYWDAVRPR